MDAVINLNHYAVRIVSEKNNYTIDENSIVFDSFGILSSFKLVNIGLFINLGRGKQDLLLNDQHLGLIPGYYKESAYKLYINGQLSYNELTNPINYFDCWELAQKGDLAEMRMVDAIQVGFWHEKVFEFKINFNESGKPRYTKPPILNTDINSDTYCDLKESTNPASDNPDGSFDHLIPFYSKHTVQENGIFGWTNPLSNSNDGLINSTRGQDGEEISFATFNRLMIYNCWGIYNVYKHAIDALTMVPKEIVLSASRQKYYEFNNLEYNSLSISDQVVADLFWEWGTSIITYLNQETPSFTIPKSFNLNNNNTGRADEYHEMYSYYSALNNFYFNFKYINSIDQTFTWSLGANPNPYASFAPEVQRLLWLFRLNPKNVGSFLSPSLLLKVLDYFIQVLANDDDSHRFQQIIINVLKIYNTPTEANELLDYLLIANDTENTNFKILYENFDDSRIHRYPIVGLFADTHSYRMQFIHYIYQLWKISKYNFHFAPEGVEPIDEIINPSCYFFSQEGQTYFEVNGTGDYKNTIIEFHKTDYGGNVKSHLTFKPKSISKNNLTFNVYETLEDVVLWFDWDFYKNQVEYHIYQPLCLTNYESDTEISFIPNNEPIPAFLFYYANEYSEIKKFDAAAAFTIELGLEAGLFLIGGGVASVRHLTHLRHITKLKHLQVVGTTIHFTGGVTAETAVLVWKGIEAGSTLLSIKGSVLMSLCTYKSAVASAEGNIDEMNRYQKISKIFLFIALGSAGASILSRNQAMKYADDVLNSLPTNGPTLVPDDVLEVLVSLKSIKDVKFALFQNRINNINSSLLGQTSHIPDFYNGLNSSQKSLFFKHFENYTLYPNPNSTSWKISDIEFWRKMNQTIDNVPAARLDLWKNAPIESIALKKDIRHLDGYVHMIMKDNEFHFTHFTQKIFAPNSSTPIGAHLWEHYHIMNAANNFEPAVGQINIVIGELPPPSAGGVYQNIQNLKPIDDLITTPQGHKVILSKQKVGIYYCDGSQNVMSNTVVWKGKKMIRMGVDKKDVINPNWSAGRLKSEIAEAYKNMTIKETSKLTPLPGQSLHRLKIVFESHFIDGQKIEIVFMTKNNVAGQLYYNPWNIHLK